MSAPRKIWVQPIGGIAFRTEQPSPEYSHVYATYHHDDVVRELVEALERARGYLHWGRDRHKPVMAQIDDALAKIAQEG